MSMDVKYKNIFIFGEVLFDCFEDGSSILGGAPFNVSWHLKGLGLEPQMITAVGTDHLGDAILDSMQQWGMDTKYISQTDSLPTGMVDVKLDSDGVPEYTITDHVAYDAIPFPDLPENPAIFYHGSLALRHGDNRIRCQKIKTTSDTHTFVDINLRSPWWDEAIIADIIRNTDWLKLNHEELPLVARSAGCETSEERSQVAYLRQYLKLGQLLLTKGADGAVLYGDGESIHLDVKPSQVVDTVGAGDAFSAVVLYGLFHGWKEEVMLQRAVDFAAKVCSLRGAITKDQAFYHTTLQEWNHG